MAYSEASKKATMKHIKNNLDDIKFRVPKGKKEEYKEKIASIGYKSMTKFIIDAINEKIERENKKNI